MTHAELKHTEYAPVPLSVVYVRAFVAISGDAASANCASEADRPVPDWCRVARVTASTYSHVFLRVGGGLLVVKTGARLSAAD